MNAIHRHGRNDDGVALLLSLLFIVLLTVLVVEYAYETQVDTSLVAANLLDYQAQVAAKSAIAMGVSVLTADAMALQSAGEPGVSQAPQIGSGTADDPTVGGATFDSLDEMWGYGIPFQSINKAIMQCSIDDEYGKINLNALLDSRTQEPNETLENALRFLFEARGAEEDPTDAILDWIDSDDETRPNGAETDYYQSLLTPYPCKNAPLSSVEELMLIRGVTPALYFGDIDLEQLPLSEVLTVHGHRNGRVNINTAEAETLTAMGDSLSIPGLAELVIEERQRSPFSSNAELQQRGIMPAQPSTPGGESGARAARPFTVSSSSYRLYGNGICGDSRVRIEAFLTRDPSAGVDGIRITEWKELR
ncbi:MAG: type II secretion system minor pseudopilin GspK [Candidatus Hydrogenedentes bacterium]|nr:type II secretion system minor pseudopilin GspK [Candidatus Hydrogenedentota bacterium]